MKETSILSSDYISVLFVLSCRSLSPQSVAKLDKTMCIEHSQTPWPVRRLHRAWLRMQEIKRRQQWRMTELDYHFVQTCRSCNTRDTLTIPNIIPTSSTDIHRHTNRQIWEPERRFEPNILKPISYMPKDKLHSLIVPFYQILNEQNEVRKTGHSTQEYTPRKLPPAHSSMWHLRQGSPSVPVTETAKLLPGSSFIEQPPREPMKTSY